MTIDVNNRSGVDAPESEIESLLTFGIDYMDLHPECEISVTFVDDKEMEELHIKWMDEPGTTDVLSFPMDMPEGKDDAVMLGDIVIDPIVAANQAATAGHSTEHELSHDHWPPAGCPQCCGPTSRSCRRAARRSQAPCPSRRAP